MAARSSMANLITRLRRMIGDQSATQVFEDDELQDFLDVHRTDERYLILTAKETRLPAPIRLAFLNFYSPNGGDWEEDVVLVGPSWATLTPDTSDYVTGHWTFLATQLLPVYITGKRYDLNGAAADGCEAWAAKVKLQFDFSDQNVKYSLSQKHKALMEQASTYRAKQAPTSATMIRTDVGQRNDNLRPY